MPIKRSTVYPVLAGLVALLAGLATFSFSTSDKTSAAAVEQLPAAPIALADIPLVAADGSIKTFDHWQQDIIVVNFWAPWCLPCRREIPALIALQQEFEGRVQILGIALDGAENVAQFESEMQMNYPSFLALGYTSMYNAVFNNSSASIPFTAVIDQKRQIHFTHNGELSLEDLRKTIKQLL